MDEKQGSRGKIPAGVNLVAGLWLMLAPFLIGYASNGVVLWNDLLVGVALAVLALIRLVGPTRLQWVSSLNFLLGLWLIIGAFLLYGDLSSLAAGNDLLVGFIVLVMASLSLKAGQPAPAGSSIGITVGERAGEATSKPRK